MGTVGHFQDAVQVPHPRPSFAVGLTAMFASFLVMPYIAWVCPPIIGDVLRAMLGLLVPILIVFPNIVFLFGIGSVMVYALATKMRGRTRDG